MAPKTAWISPCWLTGNSGGGGMSGRKLTMTEQPPWMAYASTSEIEEHESLTTAIRIIDDAMREQKAPLVKRAHEIRDAAKARVQRANRQASQLAAE